MYKIKKTKPQGLVFFFFAQNNVENNVGGFLD